MERAQGVGTAFERVLRSAGWLLAAATRLFSTRSLRELSCGPAAQWSPVSSAASCRLMPAFSMAGPTESGPVSRVGAHRNLS